MSITRRGFLGMAAAAGASPLFGNRGVAAPAADSVPKRKFGRHDELVSVVGVGGQTLGQAKTLQESIAIAHTAIEKGATFFDNAYDYLGGRAEEVMGKALAGGWRDKVFLMTKCCTHTKPLPDGGKEGAMKMLETSLKRLGTDHLDLWMLHMVQSEAEVDKFYGPGGAHEAFDLAKKQGKVRYTGWTGHNQEAVEPFKKIIAGGYPFDACLMPVSAIGALSAHSFEQEIMPILVEKRIACLGMKGFGGAKRPFLHGKTNISKIMRYSLSYPDLCTQVVGMDEVQFVDQAVLASHETPMTVDERNAFALWMHEQGGDAYATYRQPGYTDCPGCRHTA